MPDPRLRTKKLLLTRVAAGLALLLLAPLHPALGKDDVAAAEAAAKAGEETTEGKKFGEALGQGFGREHGRTIQACAKQEKRPDLSDFDLFVRVDGAGVVDQALVRPATALSTCVRDKMPGWKISAPPRAGFWVRIGVNLKGK